MITPMEERHSLAIRLFHWLNMIAITLLCLTGFYIHAPLHFRLFSTMDNPRFFHFLMAYVLIFGVIGRVYYAIATGDWRNVLYNVVEDTKKLPSMIKYYTFLADSHPDYGKYNPGQKGMYTGLVFMVIVMVYTGVMLLYPNSAYAVWNSAHIMSYATARMIHYIFTWFFILCVMVHVYLDLSEGIPVLMSMFTGKLPVGFHHTSDDHHSVSQ
ncbi:MAG: Ni/Fe-hydrogenase, b-type cytochrome subunit [Solirubrobacterales bacterium]